MNNYAELRAALAAGPTPGPWRVQDGCSWRRIGSDLGDGDILRPVVNKNDGWPDLAARQETLNYIAACHPEAIRALLAERDALREALDLVADLSSQEWNDQNGKRMAATGNDGKRFWFINDDVMQGVRAALAQEQGEKHDNKC